MSFPINFNPRSHERSDELCNSNQQPVAISIHAPTRGATSMSMCKYIHIFLFQSTLPREERPFPCINSIINVLFQSTLPREERQRYVNLQQFVLIFQSTLPREERQFNHSIHFSRFLFQSTLPREERRSPSDIMLSISIYFNPRSHERSDSNIAQKICLFLYNTDNKYIIR